MIKKLPHYKRLKLIQKLEILNIKNYFSNVLMIIFIKIN